LRRNNCFVRIFIVAKKKAKRKSANKPQTRKKRPKGMFWGDGLLAFFYCLQAFFLLGGIGVLASIALALDFAKQLKLELLKKTPDPDIVKFINGLDQTKGIGIAVAMVVLIPIVFVLIRGISRANKFSLAFVVIENGANIAYLLMSTKNEARMGAILPIFFLIYGLLRLLGAVGPKIR